MGIFQRMRERFIGSSDRSSPHETVRVADNSHREVYHLTDDAGTVCGTAFANGYNNMARSRAEDVKGLDLCGNCERRSSA